MLCLALSYAGAQPVDIRLEPGDRTFSLPLPDAAFAGEDLRLSVGLDGYDVTGFASIDEGWLHVELETPLGAGEHTVALYAFHPDDQVETLVDTTLVVPEADQGGWALNTTLDSSYRAEEHPGIDYSNVDRLANTGSAAFSASDSSGNRGAGVSFETVYDGAGAASIEGETWLLPTYELYAGYSGRTGSAWAVAGNIAIARDDLLFAAFQRRGGALEASAGAGRFNLKAFAVSSQPRSGFDGDYLFPADSDTASTGLSTSLVVVEEHLELAGGYVDGKSGFGGDGYNAQFDELLFGGASWNLAVDSRWLGDGVWLHLERAASDFDADGIGVGRSATGGDATQATLQLVSGEHIGAGPFAYWSAVLRHSRVGRDYYSLGNLALPGNLGVNGAWFQGGFTNVVADAEFVREKTNPDDDPALPTQVLARSGLSIAWSPAILNPDKGLFATLGAPSVSVWSYRIDNHQPDDDALVAGFDLDNVTDDRGVTLSFAREGLGWSLEYGAVDYDDRSVPVIDNGFVLYEPYSDSRTRYLSIAANWAAAERLVLEAWLQRNRLEETDYADLYRSTNYGVSGNLVLVPDRVNLFASLSRGMDGSRFGDPQYAPERLESNFASVQVDWRVTDAEATTPALNLFLKGNYGRNENAGMLIDEDFWAVYVGATLNWMESK